MKVMSICVLFIEPGVVQCNPRWDNVTRSENRFDIAVSWRRPIRENGRILHYYLRLLSYDGEAEIDSASVSANTRSYLFTGQILCKSIYKVIPINPQFPHVDPYHNIVYFSCWCSIHCVSSC